MKNNLIFGGINTADYGILISGSDTFAAPSRSVEYVSVPGRNGDLIIDNGKWNNVKLTYPAFLPNEFADRFPAFRSAIMQKKGYQRLEDSYNPEEYRMASLDSGLSIDRTSPFLRYGDFDLTFNCKPQRFLKSGDTPIQFMPFYVFSTALYSKYVPVPAQASLTFHVHCASADRLTINIAQFDSTFTSVGSTNYTCGDGNEVTVTFNSSAKYWRMTITGYSAVDTTWLRIQTITEHNGEAIPVDAIMCRKFTVVNPTGYACKPLIECYSTSFSSCAITNINAQGEKESGYVFNISNVGTDHFWMDCDMQYVYDDSKNNLTDKLFLTDMESDIGQGLVFPDFGTDQIDLYMYFSTGASDTGIGLIQIYPRWWKL